MPGTVAGWLAVLGVCAVLLRLTGRIEEAEAMEARMQAILE